MGLRTPPKPWEERAPEGRRLGRVLGFVLRRSSGRTMDTLLFTLRLRRVRLEARERTGELLRMPPGEGSAEIWLMLVDVWSSEVPGSK